MRSSSAAHVSVRPRDPNRVLLYKQSSSSKRRSRGDAVQFKAKLSGFLSLLIAFVCLGGLLAINFHPYPAEGDIVVAAGRKELSTASGGSSAAVELYTLLESLVDIDGRPLSQSSDIRDKVLLISNVASQCGFTGANYENFQKVADDHNTIYQMVKMDRIYNEQFLEKAKTSPHEEEVPEILKDIYNE